MAGRPPQHPFSRPQDRPLIHNPNHQPNTQPQHPSYLAHPASQQPPVQIPFSDPFPRHDPFLPSAHARRGSHGLQGRDSLSGLHSDRAPLFGGLGNTTGAIHHIQSSAPPPPPSLPPAHNAPAQMHKPWHLAGGRRMSLGGGASSSPQQFGGAALDPPPPPPAFGRTMPPPSPPQQARHTPLSATSRVPPPPSFTTGRDLPGLGAYRTGSMSISSIIGDSAGMHQPPRRSPPASSTASSPKMNAMQPPSPRRRYSVGPKSDYGQLRRPRTPDRYSFGSLARPGEAHPQATSSSPRAFGGISGSPEQAHRNPLHTQQQIGHDASGLARFSQSSPKDRRDNEPDERARMGASGLSYAPPRPNSQPTEISAIQREVDTRDRVDHFQQRRPFLDSYGQDNGAPREPQSFSSINSGAHPYAPQAMGDRERPVTVQPSSRSLFSPPQEHRQGPFPHGAGQHALGGSTWDARERTEDAHEAARRRLALSSLFRAGFGDRPVANHTPGAMGTTREDITRARNVSDPISRTPMGGYQHSSATHDHPGRRSLEQYQAQNHPDQNGGTPMSTGTPATAPHGGENSFSSRGPIHDPYVRRQGEEPQHRSFLGVSPEANRRLGRASPLPQAVQGAQAQLAGPSGDPGIKSEFGRMFSGLGGGLGSAPPGNGTSTPSRQSPMPQRSGDGPEVISVDIDSARVGTSASRNARRGRKVKDEGGQPDSESGDGRGTPDLGSFRGNKRAKHTHAGHHHHHHPHSHHHHHHHHKPDDEFSAAGPSQPPNAPTTPFHKFPTALPQPPPTGQQQQAAAHHHHHHHPPHHHHHAPPKPALPLPKKPTITVQSQAVLDACAHLPRNHLGSHLYTASVQLPPQKTPLGDKFGYASHAAVLPRFAEDQANCTFTVRVPRYYLKPDQREMITRTRWLWGSGVYTDDSDPVAAAIHGGWVRGELDEDEGTVAELIGLGPPNRVDVAAFEEGRREALVLEKPSEKGPVVPPEGFDLHVTLLVLPRLEKYVGTTQFGIKSGSWGGNHDGMSYMVLKCEFVDEGGARTTERTAKARRERLRAAMGLMSLFASGGTGGSGDGVANGGQGQMAERADGGRIGVVGA